MAQRVVPEAAVAATASPVDRFVTPVTQYAERSPWEDAAAALTSLNPNLQKFVSNRHDDMVSEEEALGEQAEQRYGAQFDFEKNREGWGQLISQVRKDNPEAADRLSAASPHFRRGVVRSRLNRLGMGLNDHLLNLWRENPEINGQALHDVDDPMVVDAWMKQQAEAYAGQYGIYDLDPVLVQEVWGKRMTASFDSMMSRHTEFRLNRYQEDYYNEMSGNMGLILSGAGTSASDVGTFMEKMGWSESGGNYGVVNDLGYTGKFQFGPERLADFNRANGSNVQLHQLNDTAEGRALQNKIMRWHIADIDSVIQQEGYLEAGWSLDGLRAVAHLGGIGGMKKFVETEGGYNPDDGYVNKKGKKVKGTKLSDYYQKFSGPAAELQATLDTAVADGINPTKANKTLVEQVITSAIAEGNPELLNVLDHVDTGNGPLGNVGWVRKEMEATRIRIEDQQWKQNEREYTLAERERNERSTMVHGQALRLILEDPDADIGQLISQANRLGKPELAARLRDYQRTLQTQEANPIPDGEYITGLRVSLSNGSLSGQDFHREVMRGVQDGKMSHATALQLLDDADNSSRFTDLYADRQVQAELSDFERIISDANTVLDEWGNRVKGTAMGNEARNYVERMVADWVSENPEGSVRDLRAYVRDETERLIKSQRFHPQNVNEFGEREGEARPYGEASEQAQADDAILNALAAQGQATLQMWGDPSTWSAQHFDYINQAAARLGVTAQEFLRQNGVNVEGN